MSSVLENLRWIERNGEKILQYGTSCGMTNDKGIYSHNGWEWIDVPTVDISDELEAKRMAALEKSRLPLCRDHY